VRGIVVPEVEGTNGEYGQEYPVLEFHITPPFTSPSGPVQWRLANIQPRIAVIPITVKVMANANTRGWSSFSSFGIFTPYVADS
jgi:hypothetical protein